MSTELNTIEALAVKELLQNSSEYLIPIYQRNYAWGAKEIEQLIQDVIDYSRTNKGKNYYIGTLVVAAAELKGKMLFSTIDGQQRLTTLSILTSVLKNEFEEVDVSWFDSLNLHFESRPKSASTMEVVFSGSEFSEGAEANIKNAYSICLEELQKMTNENGISVDAFASYLYEYVKILRVPLPNDMDLNHYFEIMNSRGEQLEKHEVLKAKLMESFNSLQAEERNRYSRCFNMVWEACSNMERYVQYGFVPEQRHVLFGQNDWNILAAESFDELVEKLSHGYLAEAGSHDYLGVDDIIKGPIITLPDDEREDSPDRFNTVINFQNFLLHVLRVQTKDQKIALDDKRLLVFFEEKMRLHESDRISFVKEFIFHLLKCKFLFDKFIIKREFTGNKDKWSLKSLKWYSGSSQSAARYVNTLGEEQGESLDSDNRRIIMLLAMFHTSLPSMSYKYWLYAALNYLYGQLQVNGKHYISYLEHIAKAFVFDRYLATKPKDYPEMIEDNLVPVMRETSALNFDKLRYKGIENNLVFNFVDYLLWLEHKDNELDARVKTFEFTFRSSVEHYYPQTPINPSIKGLDESYLHSFGNLCLISHEKNSRFSNYPPEAKKYQYGREVAIDSVKQFLMMKRSDWSMDDIIEHDKQMKDLLHDNMNSDYDPSGGKALAIEKYNYYRSKNPNLLVRALLGLGDYPKHVGTNRYNFLDFNYLLEHEVFRCFEAWVDENPEADLQTLIEAHLLNTDLQKDYRYLFIKHPEVIDFCKEGNFQWFDDHQSELIYLLQGRRRSIYTSRELYTYLVKVYFENSYNLKLYADWWGVCLHLTYENGKYDIAQENSEKCADLWIWNESGRTINHRLTSQVNGNSMSIKHLANFKWDKTGNSEYQRLGKPVIYKLTDNCKENEVGVKGSVLKLLKNGFGIELES